jgi:putative Mg2+ transporter-C (MgtC) family protein
MEPFSGELDFLINRLAPQLITATLCGFIIGYGREKRNRPAGIRTNILIALGCTLYTALTFKLTEQFPQIDPTRVIGQIAVGVGFLGAGTIQKSEQKITGITTAAFIWVISAIGVMIGYNMYLIPLSATLFIVLITAIFEKVEKKVNKQNTP